MEPLKIDWKPVDFLNFQDLNRIEEWNGKLVKDLQSRGYDVKYKKKANPWNVKDIPTISDLNRIRQNIEWLKDGYFAIPKWRDMVFDATHDFERQNAMEWDLQQCHTWFQRMIQIFAPLNIYQTGYVGYLRDELYYWDVIPYPTMTNTHVYNGESQTPSFTDERIVLSKQSKETDAGSYTVGVKPAHGYKWDTGVSTVKDYGWKIEKAASAIEVLPKSLTMTRDNYKETLAINYNGDGIISAFADSDKVRIVSVDNKQIKLQSQYVGPAKITVSAPEGKNYFAPADATCSINVESVVIIDPICGTTISGGHYYLPVSVDPPAPVRLKGVGSLEWDSAAEVELPRVVVLGVGEQNGSPTPDKPVEPKFLEGASLTDGTNSAEIPVLRALPDCAVYDKYDVISGVLTRNIKMIVLNGSADEKWAQFKYNGRPGWYVRGPRIKFLGEYNNSTVHSDHFGPGKRYFDPVNTVYAAAGGAELNFIWPSGPENRSQLISWLQKNPITVWGAAEPISEQYAPVALHQHHGHSHILQQSGFKAAEIEADAYPKK